MPVKFRWIIIMLTALLGGCAGGIEERIYLKADGSGKYTQCYDLTEMASALSEMLAGFEEFALEFDSSSTFRAKSKHDYFSETLDDIRKDIDLNEMRIDKIRGITAYREYVDTTEGKFVYGFTFDFKDFGSLTNALSAFYEHRSKKNEQIKSDIMPSFTFANGTLSRNMKAEYRKSLVETQDISDEGISNLIEEYGNLTYTVVYEFEQEIEKITATGAVITQAGNKVTLEYDMKGIALSFLESEIKLK